MSFKKIMQYTYLRTIYAVQNKILISNLKTYNELSETCKNIKIDKKILIFTFLFVSGNPLYVFNLKLIFYFLQCTFF